jgi:dTDP-4-dehydrorhamnose 3,5-epimerase
MLVGKKDAQLATPEWQSIRAPITGVTWHEVKNIPGPQGIMTELFRPEWDTSGMPVVQVYQIRMLPGVVSAWHSHRRTLDRIFVSQGLAVLALFDDRDDSATRGTVNEFHIGELRPTLVVIPPGVWHGLQNLGTGECVYVNLPGEAYDYADPDHYRLPPDTTEIPYQWRRATA